MDIQNFLFEARPAVEDEVSPFGAATASRPDGVAPFGAVTASRPDGASSLDVLTGLNEAQARAVQHSGTPLLIMAGAGSGKTRVLTHRIAYILQTHQARPGEILAITFTNKAAAEMRERTAKLIGPEGRRVWVSTFHSACVRILREHHDAVGLKSTFSIYDMQDSQRLLSMVLKDHGVDTKRFTPRMVSGRISDLKNELIGPGQYIETAPSDPISQMVAKAYKEYNKRLRQANALDFDDLIMLTVEMLQKHPGIAEAYHRRFRQIMVDEYQDTNHAQYVLVRELVGDGSDGVEPAQLTVVGDSDQSIYAFRGASIRNIEEFEQDYKDATTVLLEQNYRSTQNILDAANAVISRNRGRRAKNLWTAAGKGPLVALEAGDSEHDEARLIISELRSLDVKNVDWGDIAIFYRTNAQSRVIEEMLLRSGIPYKIVGGTRFYERLEVKDALAYLQAVVNPDNTVALRRTLNTPKRGIGDSAQAAIAAHADRYGLSFGGALADTTESSERPVEGLAPRARASAAQYWGLLEEMRALDAAGETPAVILEKILDSTGYLAGLRASTDPQDASRVENLAELVSVAEDFANEGSVDAADLGAFLERIALVADADQIPGEAERRGQVTLMTVHTAKGLEFPYVFVTGLEDGIFPHKRSMDDESELAEERRLAYVALTRAQKQLYLTRAATRSAWGAVEHMPPSRFLDDLPAEAVEIRSESTQEKLWKSAHERARQRSFEASEWGGYGDDDGGPIIGSGTSGSWGSGSRGGSGGRGGSGSRGGAGSRGSFSGGASGSRGSFSGAGSTGRGSKGSRPGGIGVETSARSSSSGGSGKASSAEEDAPTLSLTVGDRVMHATLGEGVVVGTEGSGRSAVAKIAFDSATKRLLLRMAPLTKL